MSSATHGSPRKSNSPWPRYQWSNDTLHVLGKFWVVLGISFTFQDWSSVWNFDQLIRSDRFVGVTKKEHQLQHFWPAISHLISSTLLEQSKSEGFESCDQPIVRKRPIWVKIGDALYRVTLKFDGWPWKTIGHLSFAVSSFVQHFIAIREFKLELLSGNAQFGSNSTIFRAVWPWNLTYDLEKQ